MYAMILTAALAAGPEAQLVGPYGVVPRSLDRLAFNRLQRRYPFADPRFYAPRPDPFAFDPYAFRRPRFDPRFRGGYEYRLVYDPRTGGFRYVLVPRFRRW